jgi:hypothetical protein
MANSAQSFKAPQCEKRPQQTGAAAQKVRCWLFTQIQSVPAATSSKLAQNSSTSSSVVAIGLGEARRHELDKFRERVAACRNRIPLDLVERKAFPACSLWRAQMTHSAPAIARVAVRRRDPGPSQEGRELHADLKLGAPVRRGAN